MQDSPLRRDVLTASVGLGLLSGCFGPQPEAPNITIFNDTIDVVSLHVFIRNVTNESTEVDEQITLDYNRSGNDDYWTEYPLSPQNTYRVRISTDSGLRASERIDAKTGEQLHVNIKEDKIETTPVEAP